MADYKWIRPNMDLYYIAENPENIIDIINRGNLDLDLDLYIYKKFKWQNM